MTTPVVAPRSGIKPPTCSRSHSPPTPEQPPKKKQKPTPPRAISPEVARRRMTTPVVAPRSGLNPPRAPAPTPPPTPEQSQRKNKTNLPRAISPEVARRRMTTPVVAPRSGLNPPRAPAPTPLRHRSNLQEKNNIVIPEFSAWLTLVLEQCRAENIRNLPRQRAPTPLFPERRPREACSMPISGCHDLPLATFNSPVVNTRPTPEQPPKKKTTSSFRNFPRG